MTDAEARELLKQLWMYVTNEHPAEDFTITELAHELCNVPDHPEPKMIEQYEEITNLL